MRGSTRGCSRTGRAIVLDTGAILSGTPLALPHACYTTRLVAGEVLDRESREVLDKSIAAGRILVVDPGEEYLGGAIEEAKRGGLLGRLSEADISVAALALELSSQGCEVLVATDDYALQALLYRLGLRTISIRYRGIGGRQGR